MIHRISSLDDPRLEPYRHVADSRWLRARDLFVAEGRLVVERLLAAAGCRIASILVNRAACEAMFPRLASGGADVYVCEDRTLSSVTGFNFHRGCLALAVRPAPRPLDGLLSASRLLALEGVGNPDNVGGLFRTAAAFGASGVVLDRRSGDPLYRKAIRTSMGAVLRLPFARLDDWPAGLERLRQHGFRLVALTPRSGALPVVEFASRLDPPRKLVLLVGTEGAGLQDATLDLADACVRIPIDRDIDSLNVVVAAAVALDRLR